MPLGNADGLHSRGNAAGALRADGERRFFATIPGLKGLWAEDATLEACREELQSTLEDWIMIKVRFGDKDLPVLNGIDLNPKPEHAQAD